MLKMKRGDAGRQGRDGGFTAMPAACAIGIASIASITAVTVAVWAVLAPATAAADPAFDQTVRTAIEPIFAETGALGMVVAVQRGTDLSVQGFGQTGPGTGRTPDGKSLVRLGSISKVLAAKTLVALADDGKLNLTDPLQAYAPAGMRVPVMTPGQPITLLNLATHTSGLPRMAGAAASEPARWRWLQRQDRLERPGKAAVYSNIAFDLLADALARAGGAPYGQVLAAKVTMPLGLHDTTAAPNADQCARLMKGGDGSGWKPCGDASAVAGSAGLYSTADDMAIWMRQELDLDAPETVAATRQRAISQAVYFRRSALEKVEWLDNGGKADGIGLAWIQLAAHGGRPEILEKTGGGNGFVSYVALVPAHKTGIFVAISRTDVPMLRIVAAKINDLAAALVPQPDKGSAP